MNEWIIELPNDVCAMKRNIHRNFLHCAYAEHLTIDYTSRRQHFGSSDIFLEHLDIFFEPRQLGCFPQCATPRYILAEVSHLHYINDMLRRLTIDVVESRLIRNCPTDEDAFSSYACQVVQHSALMNLRDVLHGLETNNPVIRRQPILCQSKIEKTDLKRTMINNLLNCVLKHCNISG